MGPWRLYQQTDRGTLLKLVKSAAVKHAPGEAMINLGECVQQLIYTLVDNYEERKPFRFSKLEIKYGF